MKSTTKNQNGFTIIELIIATSVFSVILLIATTGIVTLGKRYHKGLITSRTQETARSLSTEISDSIQLGAKGNLRQAPAVNDPTDPAYYNVRAVCIGSVRYSYVLNSPLTKEAVRPITRQHVLWRDMLKKPDDPCVPMNTDEFRDKATPVDTSSLDDASAAAQRREMLSSNMRLIRFNVTNNVSTLYKVDIKVMYGVDDVIDNKGNADASDDICLPSNKGGTFCSEASLSTFVKRRL